MKKVVIAALISATLGYYAADCKISNTVKGASTSAQVDARASADEMKHAFSNKMKEKSPDIPSELLDSIIVADTGKSDMYAVLFAGNRYLVNEDLSLLVGNGQNGIVAVDLNDEAETEIFSTKVMPVITSAIHSDVESTIDFVADDEKATAILFLDPYCPYCGLAINAIEEYNKLGITVKVAAMPVLSVPQDSADTAARIWGAEDPKAALLKHEADITEFRKGDHGDKIYMPDLPSATEEGQKLVANHLKLGSTAGTSGVPLFVGDNGAILPGFLPPAELARNLIGQIDASTVESSTQEAPVETAKDKAV